MIDFRKVFDFGMEAVRNWVVEDIQLAVVGTEVLVKAFARTMGAG